MKAIKIEASKPPTASVDYLAIHPLAQAQFRTDGKGLKTYSQTDLTALLAKPGHDYDTMAGYKSFYISGSTQVAREALQYVFSNAVGLCLGLNEDQHMNDLRMLFSKIFPSDLSPQQEMRAFCQAFNKASKDQSDAPEEIEALAGALSDLLQDKPSP